MTVVVASVFGAVLVLTTVDIDVAVLVLLGAVFVTVFFAVTVRVLVSVTLTSLTQSTRSGYSFFGHWSSPFLACRTWRPGFTTVVTGAGALGSFAGFERCSERRSDRARRRFAPPPAAMMPGADAMGVKAADVVAVTVGVVVVVVVGSVVAVEAASVL